MKIGIAQINTKLGDIEKNTLKIEDTIRKIGNESDVIVFPEMSISGYPLNDLLDDEDMVKKQKEVIYKIRNIVNEVNENLKVILGFIDYNEAEVLPSGEMKKYNAAAVIGKDVQIYHKRLLPNYDVFFEQRYFAPGKEGLTFKIAQDLKGAMTICEDIRDDNYEDKPIQEYKNKDVDVIFNISSSPYANEKIKKRLKLLRKHAENIGSHMVYVNQVGGQDELVFDGGSMVVTPDGCLQHISKRFQEDISIVDTDKKCHDHSYEVVNEDQYRYSNIIEAMKLGLKDYLEKTGIKNVVIGVSGGIDSALSLYILSKVLDPENIHAIYMPTKYNSNESRELSKKLTKNLGVELKVGEIQDIVKSFEKFGEEKLGKKPEGITHENIQARIRGMILMNIANDVKGMVINNSNKTELAMGYGTLYGDLIGGLSLIGDLNKKEIYEMARYINAHKREEIIPAGIIDRKASAELAEGQVDPFDYEKVSDAIEELQFGANVKEVAEKYNLDLEEVKAMRKRIKINEFKIRQAPPVIKLKERSVGIGRLYPIVE
ncbi:NAD+ synthase [Candidatus Gracilibacteria bacterium]|nr:NAD+ synthase [Candidatus Gracilibacteria bacterium]